MQFQRRQPRPGAAPRGGARKSLRQGLFALAFLIMAQGDGVAQPEVVDRVAAVVNEEIITLSDIRWLVRYKRLPIPDDPDQRLELFLNTLQQIVEQKLISAEAAQTPGIQVADEEVAARIEAYRQQYQSEREFLDSLAAMEMTLNDLMELVRRQLAVLKFVNLRFEPFIIVLPDEIETYYRNELVPELEKNQQSAPPMSLVEEQIREILTVEKTNKEVDTWVGNAQRKASVEILLKRGATPLPNVPGSFADQIRMEPIEPKPPPR